MAVFAYTGLIGRYGLEEQDGAITRLFFNNEVFLPSNGPEETELIKEAHAELEAYFAGKLKNFSVRFEPRTGTDYMKKVWGLLCEIPYGETVSYKEIAIRMGNAKASRAVGLANNKNPIPIFIPCHRVVGVNGALTGFRGGLDMKRQLLELEKGGSKA